MIVVIGLILNIKFLLDLGYLDFFPVYLTVKVRGDVSAYQIEGWMDNYCRNNPLHSVTDGATYLIYFELAQKK
jgi:hypothetical protein